MDLKKPKWMRDLLKRDDTPACVRELLELPMAEQRLRIIAVVDRFAAQKSTRLAVRTAMADLCGGTPADWHWLSSASDPYFALPEAQ